MRKQYESVVRASEAYNHIDPRVNQSPSEIKQELAFSVPILVLRLECGRSVDFLQGILSALRREMVGRLHEVSTEEG